jgi:ribosome biogenesis GTPase
VSQVVGEREVVFVSSVTGEGVERVLELMAARTTSVLIGSSGVGKTTLVNSLCAQLSEKTAEVRSGDDKGRHTTTGRKLFETRSGGLIIDTPGMREFGLFDSSIAESDLFSDIMQLALTCQFRDCRHESEPGCAVVAAIGEGELDTSRLESYRKLEREEAFEKRRKNAREQSNAKKRWKTITKQMRNHKKGFS